MVEQWIFWIVTIGIIATATVAGFLLKGTLTDVKSLLATLQKTISDMREFLSEQREKNKQFDELWKKLEKHGSEMEQLKEDLGRIKFTHERCPNAMKSIT